MRKAKHIRADLLKIASRLEKAELPSRSRVAMPGIKKKKGRNPGRAQRNAEPIMDDMPDATRSHIKEQLDIIIEVVATLKRGVSTSSAEINVIDKAMSSIEQITSDISQIVNQYQE